ncbi:MFS transporter [Streptomyces sp. NP160]|uniref:MFS transporter n=1 Tax=Streptomyces sp. NP160 TaxID=2586637 RepID=UPI0015D5F63D|nr:MFS transporter [Streptomyces sp. NP160]
MVVASTALSTAPTPLFPLYAARDGLTTTATTAAFAVFAVGVVVGLAAAGRSSDRWGRRRVLLVASLLEAAAAVVLAAAPGTGGLVAGRVLCGLGVGVLACTASVAVRELVAGAAEPVRRRWATAAGAMSMAGLGLGPLLAGALAQSAPAPLHLVYGVLAVALAACCAALGRLPETAPGSGPGEVLPPRQRPLAGTVVGAAPLLTAFTAFTVTGFYGGLAPEALRTVGGPPGPLAAGAAIGSVFLAGALSPQLLPAERWTGRLAGVLSVTAGTVAATTALVLASPGLLLVAAPLAGAGCGLLFASAVAAASRVAPANRAAAARAVFLAAYAGLAGPVLALGALLRAVPLSTAVVPHAALVVVLLAASLWAARVRSPQEQDDQR